MDRTTIMTISYWILIGIFTLLTILLFQLVAETRGLQDQYYQNRTNLSVEYAALYLHKLWELNQSAVTNTTGEYYNITSHINTSDWQKYWPPYGDASLSSATEGYLQYIDLFYKKYGVDRNDSTIILNVTGMCIQTS